MGAFEGSLTFRQYYVRDPLPEGWRDRFQQRIQHFAFKEIPVESEEERAIGWCNPRFALDTELFPEKYHFNEYLVLGLRVDTLKVPGPILKLYVEKEARRVMEEQKRESLSRYERAELKELVRRQLRQRILPAVKTVDMVWHLDGGVVRFWSGSEKLNLEFMELFEQTFDVVPVPDNAYTAAQAGLGLTDDEIARLVDLEPTPFVDEAAAAVLVREEAN